MADWSRPADVDATEGGDSTKQAVLDNETCIVDIYAKLNLLKDLFAGTTAQTGLNEGQPWYHTTTDTVKTYDGTAWNTLNARLMRGWAKRAAFAKNATLELFIGPGAYHIKGGLGDKLVRWDSSLTCTLTLASNAYRYVYLDDSVITSNEVVVASMIVDTATAPTWTPSLGAWYNGNDRCIFMVLDDGDATEMLDFVHEGGEVVVFGGGLVGKASTAISTAWVDCTLSYIPTGVAGVVLGSSVISSKNSTAELKWRKNGDGASGRVIGETSRDGHSGGVGPLQVDSAGKGEWTESAATTTYFEIYVYGFYLPRGM